MSTQCIQRRDLKARQTPLDEMSPAPPFKATDESIRQWSQDLQQVLDNLKVGDVIEVSMSEPSSFSFIVTAVREYCHQTGSKFLAKFFNNRICHIVRCTYQKEAWHPWLEKDRIKT